MFLMGCCGVCEDFGGKKTRQEESRRVVTIKDNRRSPSGMTTRKQRQLRSVAVAVMIVIAVIVVIVAIVVIVTRRCEGDAAEDLGELSLADDGELFFRG